MTNTNAIIRQDLWEIYPFDEDLEGCEDYDWACEMIAQGHDVVKDPAFNVYHSHGGIGTAIYQERVSLWERICAEIDKRNARALIKVIHKPQSVVMGVFRGVYYSHDREFNSLSFKRVFNPPTTCQFAP